MKEGLKTNCWLTACCGAQYIPFCLFLGELEIFLICFIPEKFNLVFFLAK